MRTNQICLELRRNRAFRDEEMLRTLLNFRPFAFCVLDARRHATTIALNADVQPNVTGVHTVSGADVPPVSSTLLLRST